MCWDSGPFGSSLVIYKLLPYWAAHSKSVVVVGFELFFETVHTSELLRLSCARLVVVSPEGTIRASRHFVMAVLGLMRVQGVALEADCDTYIGITNKLARGDSLVADCEASFAESACLLCCFED